MSGAGASTNGRLNGELMLSVRQNGSTGFMRKRISETLKAELEQQCSSREELCEKLSSELGTQVLDLECFSDPLNAYSAIEELRKRRRTRQLQTA